MKSKSTLTFIIFFILVLIILIILNNLTLTPILNYSPKTNNPINASSEGEINESLGHENTSQKTGWSIKDININTIENVILKKEEIRSVIGEEYEGVSYEFINNFTALKMFVQTPCADYFVKYDFVNDTVISIDRATIGKKMIKEEAVSEEERQKFLTIALNDSRVREALKGRKFNVKVVKYVMYAACQKARDPDSVYMKFRVDSEVYRVVLFPYKDRFEVTKVERIV